MKFVKLVCFAAAGVFAACGTQTKESKAPAAAPSQNAAPAEATSATKADLPAILIAKVPVDANGQEVDAQVETRSVMAQADVSNGDVAAAQFAQGSSVQVADELDKDTSSQQWGWFWGTPWYPGKLLGRGTWWGRNPYYSYGSYSYGYNYINTYNYGGCNYYTYRNSYYY